MTHTQNPLLEIVHRFKNLNDLNLHLNLILGSIYHVLRFSGWTEFSLLIFLKNVPVVENKNFPVLKRRAMDELFNIN